MQAFTYERPTTVDDAVALLAAGDTRALAGGTDLVPQLREGRRSADRVVDLKHVPELTAVTRQQDGGWRIGAAASIARLGDDPAFATDHPGLLAAARLIGSLQIQSRATLGGNLCNAAPSADAVPLLMSLEAETEIAGPRGRRTVAIDTLPKAPGRTVLSPGEIVTAILLPPRARRSGPCYLRFTPRREMDIAIAGAGVAISLAADGRIAKARITLASVAQTPLRVPKAESALLHQLPGKSVLEFAADIAATACQPISDTRASADYRRHLVKVLTRRALEACLAEIEAREARP
ncbi:MAG: xanthine dehydrogenase family protein subunit M [Hyphomicrobiaceae bacterium]